jgi:hypothetical protein
MERKFIQGYWGRDSKAVPFSEDLYPAWRINPMTPKKEKV